MGNCVKPSYLDSITDPFFAWLFGWNVGAYEINQEKKAWKRALLHIEFAVCPSVYLKMNLAAAIGIGFSILAAVIIHG